MYISIGASEIANNLNTIQTIRRQAACALFNVSHEHQDTNNIVQYNNLKNESKYNVNFDNFDIISNILYLIKTDNGKTISETMNSYKAYILSGTTEEVNDRIISLMSNILFYINGQNINTVELSDIYNNSYKQITSQTNKELSFDYLCYWLTYTADIIGSDRTISKSILIKDIMKYIDTNYAKSFGLYDLSVYVNRNSSYISRIIKENTGKNFSEILTDKRIDVAKKILESSNTKIGDIATQIGYPNVQYFSKIFHQKVGMPPNEYRKLTTAFVKYR